MIIFLRIHDAKGTYDSGDKDTQKYYWGKTMANTVWKNNKGK